MSICYTNRHVGSWTGPGQSMRTYVCVGQQSDDSSSTAVISVNLAGAKCEAVALKVSVAGSHGHGTGWFVIESIPRHARTWAPREPIFVITRI